MKWDLTRQKVEGITAIGGCPPPTQNVPSLASQYQEKKQILVVKNYYSSKIKSPFWKKCELL